MIYFVLLIHLITIILFISIYNRLKNNPSFIVGYLYLLFVISLGAVGWLLLLYGK